MAVRPPGNDSSEPDAIEFGIAALDARLDEADVEFPATSEELVRAIDATAIPYDASGNTIDLATALDRLPQDAFESESELLDQLHPVFEEERSKPGGTVLSQLRELLPF